VIVLSRTAAGIMRLTYRDGMTRRDFRRDPQTRPTGHFEIGMRARTTFFSHVRHSASARVVNDQILLNGSANGRFRLKIKTSNNNEQRVRLQIIRIYTG